MDNGQNSLMNCLHIPQGDMADATSVDTANAMNLRVPSLYVYLENERIAHRAGCEQGRTTALTMAVRSAQIVPPWGHRQPHRGTFRYGHTVGCILNVGTLDYLPIGTQECSTDPELGIRGI